MLRKELNAEVGKTTGSGTLELQIPGVGSMKCLKIKSLQMLSKSLRGRQLEGKDEGADMIKCCLLCEREIACAVNSTLSLLELQVPARGHESFARNEGLGVCAK